MFIASIGGHHNSCRPDFSRLSDRLLDCNAVRIARLRMHSCCLTRSGFSPWSFYVPLFGTLVNLGLLYWKRLDSPLNYVLLSTFTLLEAFTLGVATAFFDSTIVLQAL